MNSFKADRSECNECTGAEMYSCLAQGDCLEVVECYFPTKAAHDRNAALFAASGQMRAALIEVQNFYVKSSNGKFSQLSGDEQALFDIVQAALKAGGQ